MIIKHKCKWIGYYKDTKILQVPLDSGILEDQQINRIEHRVALLLKGVIVT